MKNHWKILNTGSSHLMTIFEPRIMVISHSGHYKGHHVISPNFMLFLWQLFSEPLLLLNSVVIKQILCQQWAFYVNAGFRQKTL